MAGSREEGEICIVWAGEKALALPSFPEADLETSSDG
jgi:hypothetical protein